RVHISGATLKCLGEEYETEEAFGEERSDLLSQYHIKTYFIKQQDEFPKEMPRIRVSIARKPSKKSKAAIAPVSTSCRFDEINKRVEHAIDVRSSDKLRAAYINELTLTFKDYAIESQYRNLRDEVFTSTIGCSFIVMMFILSVQVLFSVPE
ncbi:hypothetical protein scyTo_0021300, partial [Scyliorhinus torazame]|nr:hypothetical protein [Scyliorhinus torazame]